LIDNIEQSLTDIKYNIDKITNNRQQNLSEIRQQRQIFHEQIKQMRVTINSHLELYLMSVKLCSMLSINVDVLDVLITSRIDKSPTQSLATK
jgi:hypothetical protein